MSFDKEFKIFYENISLTDAKKDNLLSSKEALRNKIRTSFDDNERKKPKFYSQGSFSMKTTVLAPTPECTDYDIDDGIYLQNIDTSKPVDEWDVTPEDAQDWVYDAVKEHTKDGAEKKKKCVRVLYKGEKHVDLPIYAKKDEKHYVAVKDEGWIESNPSGINDWFKEQIKANGEQLRRVVKYLKAWKENRHCSNKSLEFWGGFQLTVLVGMYFQGNSDDDEQAFYETIRNINSNLVKHPPLNSPVSPYHDTVSDYSDAKNRKFKEEFKKLTDASKAAHEETDCQKKAEKWKDIFGNRFPNISKEECDKKIEKSSKAAPAIITGTGSIKSMSNQLA